MPFASQIHIELHASTGCAKPECHWVEVLFNMIPQKFLGACVDPVKCTYPEFIDLLTSRSFVYTQTHYATECATPYTPPAFASMTEKQKAKAIKRNKHFYERLRKK